MKIENRYIRNIGTLTASEQVALSEKAVCVVGCGGLGGGIIEGLTRMGIGRLTVIDCDVFEESNLNRQVLSNEDNIGHSKAVEARLQMKVINSRVQVDSVLAMFGEDNGRDLVFGHDIVIDALDNVEARLALEDACEAENIPLVHGAIGGWCGQVAVVMPGDRILHMIYADSADAESDRDLDEPEAKPANPPFTPAVIAAVEVSEAIKILLGKENALVNRILSIDLQNNEYDIVEL